MTIALPLISFAIFATGAAKALPQVTPDEKQILAMEALRTCPKWYLEIVTVSPEFTERLVKHLSPIFKLTTPELRSCLKGYLGEAQRAVGRRQPLPEIATVVLVNRLVFDIPPKLAENRFPVTNIFRHQIPDQYQKILWPIEMRGTKVRVVGVVWNTSPLRYNFEEEFDLFVKSFKRRKVVRAE